MSITKWLINIALVARITALLLLASMPQAAANQPVDQEWFATELAAVVAAASRYNPVSIREDREFMGAILHDGGCYAYTVGAGARRRDRITVKITVDETVDVVAFWHTHGAKYAGNRYFSDVDTGLSISGRSHSTSLTIRGHCGLFRLGLARSRACERASSGYPRDSVTRKARSSGMRTVIGQEF